MLGGRWLAEFAQVHIRLAADAKMMNENVWRCYVPRVSRFSSSHEV